MKDFTNKVAVVTGGASGIGKGIVKHCLAKGMSVFIADIERFEPGTQEQRAKNEAQLAAAMESSRTPDELAEIVFQGIIDRKLYIHTQESNDTILARAQHIVAGSVAAV